MTVLIESIRRGVPAGLEEIAPLPMALTSAQRRPALTGQCTVNYEEPEMPLLHVRGYPQDTFGMCS
jgi:hypothetical protein